MRKIFVFWIGDLNRIQPLIDKLINLNFDVEVGPTADEHDFLRKKYKYYDLAHHQKIWAFCSDVWRLHKLANNVGMYIDVSCDVGDDLPKFYDQMIKADVTLFKETPNLVATAVMFSGISNNDFYSSLLKKYSINLKNNFDARLLPIGPFVLSGHVSKECGLVDGFESQRMYFEDKEINIFELLKIRNKKTINKTGFGSWWSNSDGVYDSNVVRANSHWDEMERNWIERKYHNKKYNHYQIQVLSGTNEIPVWIGSLRNSYDNSKSKNELQELRKIYKTIPYKKRFRDLLFWSKLYRFFSGKWLKNH